MKTQENVKPVDIRPFAYAISLIDGKWKMHILFWLWKQDTLRYSELKRSLGNVTHKMLSSQLKELEDWCCAGNIRRCRRRWNTA